MAGGYQKNQERKQALSLLGKDLARRAGRKCEVCEAAGVALHPWEVPPVQDDPELERTLLLCERCTAAAEGGALQDPAAWRCLETVMWAELPALQVTAIRLLRRLADARVDWAAVALDTAYLSDEAQAWLASGD